MELTPKALSAINNRATRLQLAVTLGVTEQTIINYITGNSDNLTKVAALRVIKAKTGLTEEEILQEKLIEA